MADAHKNFATSLVATAPSPATSGTSLVVTAADGAKFPAVPFNATVWPAGVQPTTANAEIVRVTAISIDTFTITRTQESTSARTIIVGDQITANITAKALTDVETTLAGNVFQSQNGTQIDLTLPASIDFLVADLLEVGATVVFEIPTTSTLEIAGYLKAGSTLAAQKLSTPANFSAYRAAAFTVSSTATLLFDTVSHDYGGNYNPVTGLFTATVPGTYLFTATIAINQTNVTFFNINFVKNGSAIGADANSTNASQTNPSDSVTRIFTLAVGDTIGVQAVQGVGSANGNTGNGNTWFEGCLINGNIT